MGAAMNGSTTAAKALARALGLAFDVIDARADKTTAQQINVCEVPAPTFREAHRARYVQRLLRGSSLEDVHTDEAGNLVGVRKGAGVRRGTDGARCVVVSAHLDTVFGPEVAPKVVRTGRRGQILKAPGIADDAGGIAALLAIVEALDRGRVRTRDDVVFAWTVGEEALGNLRGVRHLLRSAAFRKRVSGFIALDGANPVKLVTSGPAITRYRVTFRSRGGHSWGRFGVPSPIHAAGRLIARLASVQVPSSPKTTFNVGVVSDGEQHEARAGVVVTAVPATAAIEVDLRSERAGALGRLEAAFKAALERAVEEERRRATWHAESLRARVERIGDRPAGRTPRNSRLVRGALESYGHFGMPLVCVCSSTDSTYPMSVGIPAVTIPQGGRGYDTHTLDERINIAGRERAIKAALMLVVRMASPVM